MSYGLPYQGSKNRIAKKIIDLLPPAEGFVDIFAGGCAVTHAALESGKFKMVIANDIGPGPVVFHAAASGRLPIRPKWVSREDFSKTEDPVVKYCYSFGNTGKSYLYGRDIEPLKHALHKAVVEGDFSFFPVDIQENLKKVLAGKTSLHDRRIAALEAAGRALHLDHLARLERLQRLQRLQSGSSSNLIVTQRDYRDVHISNDAVVYCDPPYARTKAMACALTTTNSTHGAGPLRKAAAYLSQNIRCRRILNVLQNSKFALLLELLQAHRYVSRNYSP